MSEIDPAVVQQIPTATSDSVDVGRAVIDYLNDIGLLQVSRTTKPASFTGKTSTGKG